MISKKENGVYLECRKRRVSPDETRTQERSSESTSRKLLDQQYERKPSIALPETLMRKVLHGKALEEVGTASDMAYRASAPTTPPEPSAKIITACVPR